jgi:hypothetical protein
MKPTREQTLQFARDAGLVVRAGEICPEWMGSVSEGYFDLAAVAYAAGVEKGKEAYEREHLRHTVPLPDALRAMQDQVAEACAKVLENGSFLSPESIVALAANGAAKALRAGEWRKYWEGK